MGIDAKNSISRIWKRFLNGSPYVCANIIRQEIRAAIRGQARQYIAGVPITYLNTELLSQ